MELARWRGQVLHVRIIGRELPSVTRFTSAEHMWHPWHAGSIHTSWRVKGGQRLRGMEGRVRVLKAKGCVQRGEGTGDSGHLDHLGVTVFVWQTPCPVLHHHLALRCLVGFDVALDCLALCSHFTLDWQTQSSSAPHPFSPLLHTLSLFFLRLPAKVAVDTFFTSSSPLCTLLCTLLLHSSSSAYTQSTLVIVRSLIFSDLNSCSVSLQPSPLFIPSPNTQQEAWLSSQRSSQSRSTRSWRQFTKESLPLHVHSLLLHWSDLSPSLLEAT